MSNYSQFFLNSSSRVVQLETFDISHPSFSKRYRVVRNSINGLTATLEDTTTGVFDYYPISVSPTGSANDLDQSLALTFGDLGQVIPSEVDRLLFSFEQPPLFTCSLFGAWTDGSGVIIGSPFQIGVGCTLYVPPGASFLSMGANCNLFGGSGIWNVAINDGTTTTNVSVHGWSTPWSIAANPTKTFGTTGSIAPATFAVTPGNLLQLVTTGTASITPNNGGGNPLQPLPNPALGILPSTYVLPNALPSSIVKPVVLYRTFRSDDLTQPLYGPVQFQIDSIAFKKEGATMQCSAPRLNITSTGETYSMNRFPMLRGFL